MSVKSFDGFAFASDYCINFERPTAKNKPQHEAKTLVRRFFSSSLLIILPSYPVSLKNIAPGRAALAKMAAGKSVFFLPLVIAR